MKLFQSRTAHLSSLLLTSCLLGACGSGPPPKLYLLEPIQLSEEGVQPTVEKRLGLLGLGTVSLPGYAVSTPIASLSATGNVVQDSEHRWAEEPAEAIARLLANRLRVHANTTVLIEPWPRDYSPAARVEVEFDRLLRGSSGGVDMAGQILLLSGDGRQLLKSVPFEIVLQGRETASRVFFVAVAQGVDDIANMIVQALTSRE